MAEMLPQLGPERVMPYPHPPPPSKAPVSRSVDQVACVISSLKLVRVWKKDLSKSTDALIVWDQDQARGEGGGCFLCWKVELGVRESRDPCFNPERYQY